MRKKYSIGLLIFIFILLTLSYYIFKSDSDLPYKIDMEQNTNLVESGFYLYESNGYIVVYKNNEVYEYTDIIYDQLPDALKTEICNGKYMKNLDDLYGFLENYTS